MDRGAGHLHAVLERLTLGVHAGKRRQQRWVDVEDRARKRRAKTRAEPPHEAGEADEPRSVRPQCRDERRIVGVTRREVGVREHDDRNPARCAQAPDPAHRPDSRSRPRSPPAGSPRRSLPQSPPGCSRDPRSSQPGGGRVCFPQILTFRGQVSKTPLARRRGTGLAIDGGPHMPRRPRSSTARHYYHVINRAAGKSPLFSKIARLSRVSRHFARGPDQAPGTPDRLLRPVEPLAPGRRPDGNGKSLTPDALGNYYPCRPPTPATEDAGRGAGLSGPVQVPSD